MWDSYDSLSVTHYRLTLCGISLTSVEEPSERKNLVVRKNSHRPMLYACHLVHQSSMFLRNELFISVVIQVLMQLSVIPSFLVLSMEAICPLPEDSLSNEL